MTAEREPQGKSEVSYQDLALFRVNGWAPAQPR
jgi:hypothetical protein